MTQIGENTDSKEVVVGGGSGRVGYLDTQRFQRRLVNLKGKKLPCFEAVKKTQHFAVTPTGGDGADGANLSSGSLSVGVFAWGAHGWARSLHTHRLSCTRLPSKLPSLAEGKADSQTTETVTRSHEVPS